MGWIIKNKDNKWDIYSTNTESVIKSFDNEKDCAKFIALDRVYKGKQKAIEELICFPIGWEVNGNRLFPSDNEEAVKEYYNWLQSIYNSCKTYEDYYKKIDDKLNELLSK